MYLLGSYFCSSAFARFPGLARAVFRLARARDWLRVFAVTIGGEIEPDSAAVHIAGVLGARVRRLELDRIDIVEQSECVGLVLRQPPAEPSQQAPQAIELLIVGRAEHGARSVT